MHVQAAQLFYCSIGTDFSETSQKMVLSFSSSLTLVRQSWAMLNSKCRRAECACGVRKWPAMRNE